ncbi:MAG TPA: hypothetical protein VMB73_31200 [Acetobacteraceae bacterium]|nr:hypothetical protein [Acetobacteraceae bacterium]
MDGVTPPLRPKRDPHAFFHPPSFFLLTKLENISNLSAALFSRNERQPPQPPMTNTTLTAQAEAYAPDADRAGTAMPENLAWLLYIVRTLLHFGRHFAALIDRRAARRGFWLFSAVFGTRKHDRMRASLHRGILRATALEFLLLKRAATGRDVAATPRPESTEDANAHPCDEQFQDQIARLTAERAQHDAPADPHNPATPESIEAEILARSIGRNIADICRDLGVVAIMCTPAFWDMLTGAIACFQHGAAVQSLDDAPPQPALPSRQPEPSAPQQQIGQTTNPCARRPSGCKSGVRRIALFRHRPGMSRPRQNVPALRNAPALQKSAAMPNAATGPPLRAATRFAA